MRLVRILGETLLFLEKGEETAKTRVVRLLQSLGGGASRRELLKKGVEAGYSVSSIEKALQELLLAGAVKRKRRRGRSFYVLEAAVVERRSL